MTVKAILEQGGRVVLRGCAVLDPGPSGGRVRGVAKQRTHHIDTIPVVGFYTARDPLVAPAPPGLVGSAGFYSATQRDLIPGDGFLEASAEASRAVAGAGRRPPAGGRPSQSKNFEAIVLPIFVRMSNC